ncbi:MAG: DNA-methyltransferase [Candidatus Hodarchaeota archaeon]
MDVNKIINYDSRKLEDIIDQKSIHFIMFSPPYWNIRNYGYEGQIGYKQTYNEFLESMKQVVKKCFNILKDGRFMAIITGTVVSNEGMKFLAGDFINTCSDVGFIFRKDIIWNKPRGTTKWQRGATLFTQNPYPLKFNTNISHEYILIFSKGEIETINYKKLEVMPFTREFIRSVSYSVWDIKPVNSPIKDEGHIAPYPDELCEILIELFSLPEEIVLDPFCGSGTTCKIAKKMGRLFIGIDKSKKYCDIAQKNVNNIEFNSFKSPNIANENYLEIYYNTQQLEEEIIKILENNSYTKDELFKILQRYCTFNKLKNTLARLNKKKMIWYDRRNKKWNSISSEIKKKNLGDFF